MGNKRRLAVALRGGRFFASAIRVGWETPSGYVLWWGATNDEGLAPLVADVRRREGDVEVVDRRPMTCDAWNEEALAAESGRSSRSPHGASPEHTEADS
jgi:hypothetical protein